jgi:hypothetical protein
MAIDTPPIYSGITYNSLFFPDNLTTGLNEAQANALYLRKTFPDTATALETFNSGIKVNAIDPTTTGGTIQIGHGSATNNVEIAAEVSRSVVLHLGDGDTSSGGIHIGNGNGASNNVQILNGAYTTGQTAGNVNILTGSHTGTITNGNVNIQTVTSKGTCTIGNSASTLSLSSGTINVNSPLTVGYVPSAITTTSQIGYTVKDTIGATSMVSGVDTNSFGPITLPAGVWLITYSFRFLSAGSSILTQYFIYNNNGSIYSTVPLHIQCNTTTQYLASNGIGLSGSYYIVSDGTTTYTLTLNLIYTGSAMSIQSDTTAFGSSVRRVRIA